MSGYPELKQYFIFVNKTYLILNICKLLHVSFYIKEENLGNNSKKKKEIQDKSQRQRRQNTTALSYDIDILYYKECPPMLGFIKRNKRDQVVNCLSLSPWMSAAYLLMETSI